MKGHISNIREVAKNVKEFTIRLDSQILFIPGKYVMLSFEDKSKSRKAYSILEYDAMQRTIKLVIKLHADFTQKLFKLRLGDEIFVYGPFGKFTLKRSSNNSIFIAGGIGIVPLYAMFKQSLNIPGTISHMFYSCQYNDEMALKEELSKLDNVQLYLTREGNKTRFSVHDITKIKDYDTYEYYICGPDKMMEEVSQELQRIGITKIYVESFNM